jgi:hypothetical protein
MVGISGEGGSANCLQRRSIDSLEISERIAPLSRVVEICIYELEGNPSLASSQIRSNSLRVILQPYIKNLS